MFRRLLLVPWLAIAMIVAMAAVCNAQYDQIYNDPVYDQEQTYDQSQATVFTVPGQVVRVIYDQGSYTADGRLVHFDQVIARYYDPDRQLREGLADAPSPIGGNRPVAGDRLTCDIDAESFGLLAVNNWHRSRPNLYFVYEPSWYYHSHLIIWPEYYQRHFGNYYRGPRFYGGHHYNGPRYRSRDGWDHQPRYGTPSPRYRRQQDQGTHPRSYVSPSRQSRRSPVEYQRPGRRDQQRLQTPSPRSRSPRDQGIRPRDIAPRSPSSRPPDQYQRRGQSGQRPGPSERPQYRQQRQHDQRSGQHPAPAERSRGSNDQSRRSSDTRHQSRR